MECQHKCQNGLAYTKTGAGALDWCLGVDGLNVYKLNKIEKDEYNELESSANSLHTINTS